MAKEKLDKKAANKKTDTKKADKAKEKVKAKKAKDKEKKVNSFFGFFTGIRGELKRTTWPSWQTVKNNTITVLAVLLTIGVFIYVLDLGFGYGRNLFMQTQVEEKAPGGLEGLPEGVNVVQE